MHRCDSSFSRRTTGDSSLRGSGRAPGPRRTRFWKSHVIIHYSVGATVLRWPRRQRHHGWHFRQQQPIRLHLVTSLRTCQPTGVVSLHHPVSERPQPQEINLPILAYGPSFPVTSARGVKASLQNGRQSRSIAGYPFDRLYSRMAEGWHFYDISLCCPGSRDWFATLATTVPECVGLHVAAIGA